MKACIKITRVKALMLFMVFTISITLFSCNGDGFDPDLKVETVVSPFSGNDAVSVDKYGNIYVSEFGRFVGANGNGTRVFKISQKGDVTELASNLTGPLGNAIDLQGNLYVVNGSGGGSGDVLKITPDGTQTTVTTIDGFPSGLTLDHNNNLYVSNFGTPTVHKINTKGEVTIFASDPKLAGGVGIDFDRKGNLIVGNFATADILSIDQKGNVSLITTIPNAVVNGFGIGYITVVGNSVFATGIGVNKIFRVSMDGTTEEFAGTGDPAQTDGVLEEASFNGPNGISSDPYDKAIYISEFGGTGGVRKIKLY